MRPVALAGILASTTILGGCAATIGGVSLSSISSFAGFASTLFTGADLGEHAASLVTGKDCRFSEGLLREDRDICEEPGSLATRDDFHGIFVERIDPDGTVIYAAPKYMPASVGAGENENDPDKIWAEIKTQKAKEENDRQLARAKATQQIDVASLAAGSLSPEALAFLPADTEIVSDGDTESQTAAAPRAVVNVARKQRRAAPVQQVVDPAPAPMPTQAPAAKTPEVGAINDQPAIDEKTLAAPLRALKANGSGGPLITTASSGAPVVSKVINGEPVVVLRIGPIAQTAAAISEQPEVMSAEFSGEATTTLVAHSTPQPATASPPPSPQAILDRKPAIDAKQATLEVQKLEPQMPDARPRRKPRVDLTPAPLREVAEVEPTQAVDALPAPEGDTKVKKQARALTTPKKDEAQEADVFTPPVRTQTARRDDPVNAAFRPADAAYSPSATAEPQDVPATAPVTPAPAHESPATAAAFTAAEETSATSGPAQLVPAPQE